MKRISVTLVALGALAGVALTSRDAHALGPVDIEVGAKAGAATNPDSNSANPLGFGIGARGGVSIFGLYGGLNAMYYLGSSTDNTVFGLPVHASASAWQLGLEVGYGVTFSVLTIRPQIGFGNFHHSASATTGNQTADASESNFYVEPGVTALIGLGIWYVGADANVLVVPGVGSGSGGDSTTWTSFTMHGQFGFKI